MDKELIERLARESGMKAEYWMTNPPKFGAMWASPDGVLKFAALVAEECLKVVDAEHKAPLQDQHWYCACAAIRDGIRAKFKGPT